MRESAICHLPDPPQIHAQPGEHGLTLTHTLSQTHTRSQEKIVEVPVERIVYRDVPVERIVTKEVPVEKRLMLEQRLAERRQPARDFVRACE